MRVGSSNLDTLLGSFCSYPRNEHSSGRRAGGFSIPIVGRKGAGSTEKRMNGRGTEARHLAGVGRVRHSDV